MVNLEVNLNDIVTTMPRTQQLRQVVEWAESRSQVKELITALRDPNFGNDTNLALKAFAMSIGADSGIEKLLEKLISRNQFPFKDPAEWRAAMVRAESVICRIENPESEPIGTGFLLGPDLVLTNKHVMLEALDAGPAQGIRCRFGYHICENNTTDDGTSHALANPWEVASSEVANLDYSLVRLAIRTGDEPIGSFKDAPIRRWLSTDANRPVDNQALFILQHPKGGTLKVAGGTLKSSEKTGWLNYEVDTEKGSSGSPVLDSGWQLIALHSRAGHEAVNRGVSIRAIRDDLKPEVLALLNPRPGQ
ncbi:trypsin-like peptidase domain-containing protein [Gemmata sp. G18]|uniref:Trypsin-like peptidase domain-containing protein n=2 Tax=Gemmata palustris TaxID=2822762 RepID=A0ABS5BY86_9BACT|nr:trypsin-like peptidase domain-containing protein [Gemmata palustris]